LKNVFAIVTLSGLLSVCVAAEPMPATSPTSAAAAAIETAAEPATEIEANAATEVATGVATEVAAEAVANVRDSMLPNVNLSSDLLYKLTRAELEFKVGQWQGAYVTMMAVAHQTRDPRIAQRAAEMALAAKQGEEALAAIRLWRNIAPESEAADQFFLTFTVLGDNLAEAEPVLRKRLQQVEPRARGGTIFQTQQILSRAQDKSAVFAMLERLLAPYGSMLETHLVLAQAAFVSGDTARAAQEAEQALALKPDSELAILTLAQVRADSTVARDLLNAFLETYPSAHEVRAAYARILIEQKDYAQARQQFLVLLDARPDNLATLYALGVVSTQLSDTVAAESYFKRFLAVQQNGSGEERDTSKVLMILSQIAEERRDIDAALALLEQVDDSDPRAYFGANVRRAQLIASRGDLDGARKLLAGLPVTDADEQAQLLLVDAQILRDGGYYQSSFTVLENGIKRFPDSVELLYDFALSAEKMKRDDLMEASLRRVMLLAPDSQHAYNALGYALAERNVRLLEAFKLIETALAMAPADPFIMDSMGWVYFRMGNLAEAEVLLRRAYAIRSDPEIAIHLGEVLWQKGEQVDARKLWAEVLAKDPQNDALKSVLTRLNLSL
jgi:tetratricopeptide (TPR) repeat protein